MRLTDLYESFASSAFCEKIRNMDRTSLEKLRGELVVRQERQRLKFARSRNMAHGEQYRKTSAELGRVKTQLRLAESVGGFPRLLTDARAIARYIDTVASEYVDVEVIEEFLWGCKAVLKELPIDSVHEGNQDANIRDPKKEAAYARMDLSTMPPIVVQDGVILDGNHRYRVAVAKGAATIMAYDVVDGSALVEGRKKYFGYDGRPMSEPDWEPILWSFNDWLIGDAMNNINDDGERYSLQPYLQAIEELARHVPKSPNAPVIYRGVRLPRDPGFEPGLIKTANKRYQSWTANYDTAFEFATGRNGTGKGDYSVILHARPSENKVALKVKDVFEWMKGKSGSLDSYGDFYYTMETYVEQDEYILKGTMANVFKIEVVSRPKA